MLKKVEVTDKNISRIAKHLFKAMYGRNLDELESYIRREWDEEAEEMLNDYNRVVDILNGDV